MADTRQKYIKQQAVPEVYGVSVDYIRSIPETILPRYRPSSRLTLFAVADLDKLFKEFKSG